MEFLIHQISDFEQVKLSIQEFKDVEYLHLRKYYLDFDEEWKPTKEGVSMPLSIEMTRNLFIALISILSNAESKTILQDHFPDLVDKILDAKA